MRKLNDEERSIVEENHNLIYSFMSKKGLDEDEYYGLIAESLCKSVMAWDKSKGKLSTLFYMIATNDLYQYWRKGKAKKRSHGGTVPLEDWNGISQDDTLDDILFNETVEEMFGSEHLEIIKLRLNGHTQREISEILGVSQVTVSRRLAKVGEIYFDREG